MKYFINQIISVITNYVTDFVNSITSGIVDHSFYVPENMLTVNGVADKYNDCVHIGNTFILLSLLICICSIYYSIDIFSVAKLKKTMNEFFLALFLLNTGHFFINKFNALANLFAKGWLPNGDAGSSFAGFIVSSIGLTNAATTIPKLGFWILALIGLVTILIFVFMITHSVLIGIMQILMIISPLVISIYPLDFGKNLCKKLAMVYGGILTLSPLQVLAINLLCSSGSQAAESPTASNLMAALGMLVLVVIFIPGLIFYIISLASNPKLELS